MPDPHISSEWIRIERIGGGGQGEIWTARSRSDQETLTQQMRKVLDDIRSRHKVSNDDCLKILSDLSSLLNDFLRPPRKYVAVKQIMPREGVDHSKTAARFRREVEVWSNIHHEGVAELIDWDIGSLWYVTPYFKSGSLAAMIQTFHGQPLKALRTIRPIVAALAKLHSDQIVHRDIKPENIMVDDDGSLKLIDFGIVLFAEDEDTRLTGVRENVGSWRWMPPWAMQVRSEDPDPSMDVYSLGKVIWAMIAGRREIGDPEYGYSSQNKLTTLFPKDLRMLAVEQMLKRSFVYRRDQAFPDGSAMLTEVDRLIEHLGEGPISFASGLPVLCVACKGDQYEFDPDAPGLPAFGQVKVFVCPRCGNYQFFRPGAPAFRSER